LNVGTTISVTLPVAESRFSASSFASTNNGNASPSSRDDIISVDIAGDAGSSADLKAFPQDVILVVEDNEDLRSFISSTLSDRFLTLTAKDGEEGLAIAIHRIPSLIIADVMMPNLYGFSLAEKIKSDERTCHIPIVLLTAKTDLESRIAGLQTGADDYLAKPFSTAELNVRVTNLIAQRKMLAAKYRATLSNAVTNREPSLDEKFLQRAKALVEENIGNPGFGVEQMAKEIYLSRAQLFRKLKAITGLSPKEFINDIRLQRAAALILAKADTVSQIGYSVGYNEQSYFAKRFRKKFGVAPSDYSSKL